MSAILRILGMDRVSAPSFHAARRVDANRILRQVGPEVEHVAASLRAGR